MQVCYICAISDTLQFHMTVDPLLEWICEK